MYHFSNKYKWFALGDLNGFFGLMFDNLTVLSFLAGTLVFVFKFPADIVYTKMFPGTAFGVLVGDLVYTWMAFRLAKRTGSHAVTAMPLGLDTPSTIGMVLVVLGPAFVALKSEGMTERDARDDDLAHRHGHDGHDLFLKPSSGAGAEELVSASSSTKIPTDWSLDGRFVRSYFSSRRTPS